MTLRIHLVAFLIAVVGADAPARADAGKPVAVRWWGQAFVTIETHWNLRIAIDPYDPMIGYADPGVAADLVLITHEHPDHANAKLVRGEPVVERGLDADGMAREIDLVLDRHPNETKPALRKRAEASDASANAVRITSIASFHDAAGGTKRGRNAMFLVEADGVRILHMGDCGQNELDSAQVQAIGRVDVLLIPVGGVFTIDGKQAAAIVAQLQPRIVVPIHYKTAALAVELQPVDAFMNLLPESYARVEVQHNTLAVSAGEGLHAGAPKVVTLDWRPWEMPAEMAALFDAMESACRAAQAVFTKLSVAQMNHKPSDGTHTPRWNLEHMAGRQLGFFSSIYAKRDANVPWIDENPKQMPPDYVAAHPDWSGAEEARRAEAVIQFTRRFAYLLDGVGLDERPEGSPWTLRRLLNQMISHWSEHTANVQKKFALPDWPQE